MQRSSSGPRARHARAFRSASPRCAPSASPCPTIDASSRSGLPRVGSSRSSTSRTGPYEGPTLESLRKDVPRASVLAMAFTPRAESLVVGTIDTGIRLHDVETLEQRSVLTTWTPRMLRFDPSGRRLLVGAQFSPRSQLMSVIDERLVDSIASNDHPRATLGRLLSPSRTTRADRNRMTARFRSTRPRTTSGTRKSPVTMPRSNAPSSAQTARSSSPRRSTGRLASGRPTRATSHSPRKPRELTQRELAALLDR